MNACGELSILQAGPHSLLQDLGRQGKQHLGFCQSGAIDEHSFLWANKLLENTMASACLEISFGPFECEFTDTTTIAITGAAQNITLNNKALTGWQSLRITPGDRLRIKAPQQGLRTYLAIKGGFSYESRLNSAAMAPRENSGPFAGQCFSRGQNLEYSVQAPSNNPNKLTPAQYIPNYSQQKSLRVFLTPEQDLFTAQQLEFFLSTEYSVAQNSNRMAYSLNGQAISFAQDIHIFSTATPYGAIQIPPNGQPIVLLKDRQTIGGYPILGYLSHIDCFALSQMRCGEKLRFNAIHLDEGQRALKEFYNFFN